MKIISKSPEDTANIGFEYVRKLSPHSINATVIGLKGDLGSGKTVFMQGVAKHFKIDEKITSPTFVLQKIYRIENKLFRNLIHIDAYRLHSGHELKYLGWDHIASEPSNVIFVEWPDKIMDIFPQNSKTIRFRSVNEMTREIEQD